MTPLAELLRQRGPSAIEEQARVNRAFERAVREGPLGWRTPHGPVPRSGLLVVVGLTPAWNSYDRELALTLERAAARIDRVAERIELFNADSVRSPSDLDALIPGAGSSQQPPFLGVWRDGELWFSDFGSSASAWLTDRYHAPV
jgi:hypothetical protein